MAIQYFDALDFDIVYRPDQREIVVGTDLINDETTVENDQVQESNDFDFRNNLIRYETFVQPQQGTVVQPGENVMLKARIWDDYTGLFITRSEVESAVGVVYKKIGRTFNNVDWIKLKEISTPLTTFPVSPGETWRYDDNEFNFVWIVDQTEPLFEEPGDYALQVRLTFANRLPAVVTFNLT